MSLILPALLWFALGLLVTRRVMGEQAVGFARGVFIASGALIGGSYAYRIAAGTDPDALTSWLSGLGIAGLVLAFGVRQQAGALGRLDPGRARYLGIGMMWIASLASGLLGFALVAALVLAFAGSRGSG